MKHAFKGLSLVFSSPLHVDRFDVDGIGRYVRMLECTPARSFCKLLASRSAALMIQRAHARTHYIARAAGKRIYGELVLLRERLVQ